MSTWGQGSTRTTRRTRDIVLKRDGHECQLRLPGCTGEATEAHHANGLQGRARNEAINPDEMTAACPHCHGIVTEQQRRAAWYTHQAHRRARKRLPRQAHPGDWT